MTAQRETEPEATLPEAMRPGTVLKKALVLLALTAVGVVLYRTTPVAEWFAPAGEAARWIAELGAVGVVAFFAVMVLAVLFGVPRLLFCPIAGALFGFWAGLALSVGGSLLSYYAVFLFLRGRYYGTRPPLRLPRRLAVLGQDPGFGGVVLARLLPLPGMVVNVALALSSVRHRAYLGGSALGLVPEAAPLVLLGAGLLSGDPKQLVELAMLALVVVVGAWFGIQWLVRRRLRAAAEAEAEASLPPGEPDSGLSA